MGYFNGIRFYLIDVLVSECLIYFADCSTIESVPCNDHCYVVDILSYSISGINDPVFF